MCLIRCILFVFCCCTGIWACSETQTLFAVLFFVPYRPCLPIVCAASVVDSPVPRKASMRRISPSKVSASVACMNHLVVIDYPDYRLPSFSPLSFN